MGMLSARIFSKTFGGKIKKIKIFKPSFHVEKPSKTFHLRVSKKKL